jgi:hypothetical protein
MVLKNFLIVQVDELQLKIQEERIIFEEKHKAEVNDVMQSCSNFLTALI